MVCRFGGLEVCRGKRHRFVRGNRLNGGGLGGFGIQLAKGHASNPNCTDLHNITLFFLGFAFLFSFFLALFTSLMTLQNGASALLTIELSVSLSFKIL